MAKPVTSYVEWKDWKEESFGQLQPAEANYFAAETSITLQSRPRVLEIGFGNGSFLGWVKSIDGEAYGIESDPVLAERARLFLGTEHVLSGLEDIRAAPLQGTITHIVAFDVIEHMSISELSSMLAGARELLAPDGKVILRFPNGDSPFGRMTQHGDPTHITTLGSQKLAYLARRAGFDVVAIRAPALPVRGVGIARGIKRCMVHIGRSVVECCVSWLYFGGQRVPLDPNYLAILERAKPP